MNSVNPLHYGANTINSQRKRKGLNFSSKIMPNADVTGWKNDRPKDDGRQEYIDYMKANPETWGRQKHFANVKGQFKNAFPLGRGWVSIYDKDGNFTKSFYFESYPKKLLKVTEAMKQIRNLKGHYVEINHII